MNQKRSVIYFTIILLSCLFGCSEEGVFEKTADLSDYPSPEEYEFSAVDFPSANGSSWTYIETELQVEYTEKIDGVRNINGTTCRRLKHQLLGGTTDFLSSNGFYLTADGEYAFRPYPVSATYFKKDLDSYTELAFEICLKGPDNLCVDEEDSEGKPVVHDTFKQEHFPPRKLWAFPMQVGNEWTVFKKPTNVAITVVRNVADIVPVTVPKDSYPNAYLVEERLYFGGTIDKIDKEPDALYWVVPGVGVVKYQYYIRVVDPPQIRTFELKEASLVN